MHWTYGSLRPPSKLEPLTLSRRFRRCWASRCYSWAPWKDPQWFERGVTLGMVYRRKVVSTDVSNTGWGALCEGKPTLGPWSKEESQLRINCLEMLAVCQALFTFLPDLRGHLVLFCSDSMTVVFYINNLNHLNLRSLRATHVPGRLNQASSTNGSENFGRSLGRQRSIFASKDNFHCQTYFSKDRDVLAHDWPKLLLYAFPRSP